MTSAPCAAWVIPTMTSRGTAGVPARLLQAGHPVAFSGKVEILAQVAAVEV